MRVAVFAALLALPAAAASLQREPPALSLGLEAGYVQTDTSRKGAGALGLAAGYRLGDQFSFGIDVLRSGGPRQRRATIVAGGFRAILDSTPVAPFLELSLAAVGPAGVAGYSVAARTALGVDWKFHPRFALGLVVRSLIPLDRASGVETVAGTETVARFVWLPGASP